MKYLAWALVFATSGLLAAQQAAHPPSPAPSPIARNSGIDQVVLPAETTIPLVLKNIINSRTAYPGEAIYCTTIFPITVGNRIVIPVGTYVKGEVTAVKRPGRLKGKAQLGLRFTTLTLPNGTTHALRATLSGFGATGNEGFSREESKINGESSKGKDAGRVAQTTVAGAEIGTIVGASSGNAAKGLGIGSAAGAAGGLISVLASRGKEIVLPAGTNLELQLNQSLSFDRDELDPLPSDRNSRAIPPRAPGPDL
jgi:hypothetical protein